MSDVIINEGRQFNDCRPNKRLYFGGTFAWEVGTECSIPPYELVFARRGDDYIFALHDGSPIAKYFGTPTPPPTTPPPTTPPPVPPVSAMDYWTSGSIVTGSGYNWYGLAYSPALTKFVAVNNTVFPVVDQLMTSPDGENWTLASTGNPGKRYRTIAWSPELNLFAMTGSNGTSPDVLTSPDGVTWTIRYTDGSTGWAYIIWAPGANGTGLFVATPQNSNTNFITSPDGITWTQRASPAAGTYFQSVAWSPTVGIFVAMGRKAAGADNKYCTSLDGITWTQQAISNGFYKSVIWCDALGLFVAAGADDNFTFSYFMTSPDGINWTTYTPPVTLGEYHLTWSPDLQRILGITPQTGTFIKSADGATWSNVISGPPFNNSSNRPQCPAVWSSELGVFVAIAQNNIYGRSTPIV